MGKEENTDRMTASERMRSLILNKPIDRIPFVPFFVGYIAIDSDISLYEFFTKPDLAFQTSVETMKRHPWTNAQPVYGWVDHGAWIFGGKVVWPNGGGAMSPCTHEALISRPEDVDRLHEPDPLKTDWFRLRDRFNRICVQNGFSATLPSGSIMTQLGSILGATNLLKWMIKYPDALNRLAEKVLNFNVKMAKITLEKYGAKNCKVMTELPLESNSILSPDMFAEFCLPYIVTLHSLYFESGVLPTLIHLCGDHKNNLKYWNKVSLPDRTIFSIGENMDLEETGKSLSEKYILAGNISTTILQIGSKEDVKEEVKRCIKQAKNRLGGFILMPSCEYPPMAPKQNLEAIRESLMAYGFY